MFDLLENTLSQNHKSLKKQPSQCSSNLDSYIHLQYPKILLWLTFLIPKPDEPQTSPLCNFLDKRHPAYQTGHDCTSQRWEHYFHASLRIDDSSVSAFHSTPVAEANVQKGTDLMKQVSRAPRPNQPSM